MKIGKAERYVILTLLFLFQPVIERYISIFKYFDEFIVLVFFLRYLLQIIIIKKHKDSFSRWIVIMLIILIVIGLVSNYTSGVNQPNLAILQDIFSNCKIFLFIIAMQNIHLSHYQQERYKNKMAKIIRLLLYIIFFCAILSLLVNIGMTDYTEGTRYGLRAFQFIYNNPAGLNTYYYLFMIIHSITMYTNNGVLRKNTTIFTIMGIIGWMLTLRSRAIAFAFVYGCIYIYIVYLKKNKKIRFSWKKVLFVAFGVLILCWDAIEKYFILNEKVSRYQLLHSAIDIAMDHFPIGSGFATFGTEASRDYYSPIYYIYNLSKVYGLSPDNPLYTVDQYWFGIFGQFGFIGIILVGLMIFKCYRNIWKISKNDKGMQLAALTLFYTSIFGSLTAGTFIQASILPSIMIFYLIRNEWSYKKQV